MKNANDRYLEQASSALSAAFVDNGDAMMTTMPDVNVVLHEVCQRLSALSRLVGIAVDKLRVHDDTFTQMKRRLESNDEGVQSCNEKVSHLLNESNGLVTWDRLRRVLVEYGPQAEINVLFEKCSLLESDVRLRTLQSDFTVFLDSTVTNLSEHRNRLSSAEERLSHSEKGLSTRLSTVESSIEHHSATLHALEVIGESLQSEVRGMISTTEERVLAEMRLKLANQNDSHDEAVERIVQCLRKHSQSIDEINANRNDDSKQLSMLEMSRVNTDIESLRRDVDHCSFSVQEAYSRCFSMLKPEMSSQMHGSHKGAEMTQKGGLVAKTLETQIEQLRFEMEMLRRDTFPMMDEKISLVQERVQDVLRDSEVNHSLLKNLLFVFADQDEMEQQRIIRGLWPSDTRKTVANDITQASDVIFKVFKRISASAMTDFFDKIIGLIRKVEQNCEHRHVSGEENHRKNTLAQKITVSRNENEKQVTVNRLGMMVADSFSVPGRFEDLQNGGSDSNSIGIVIIAVDDGSLAESAGILPGERIVQVGGHLIKNVQNFLSELKIIFSQRSSSLLLSVEDRERKHKRDVVLSIV